MFTLNFRSAALSVSLLMAGTSLAQAGFIWVAPNEAGSVAAPTAEAAPAPVMQEAPVALEPLTAPVIVSPVVAPADAVEPLPAVSAPVVSAPTPLLMDGTMSAAPIYSKGDPMPSEVVAPAAPAPVAATMVAPTAPVSLAVTTSAVPTAVSAPQVLTGTAAMPTAESLIGGMPSMTSPRPEMAAASPIVAPVARLEERQFEATPPAAPVSLVTGQAAPMAPIADPVIAMQPVVAPAAPAPAAAPVAEAPAPVVAPAAVQTVKGFGKAVPLVIAMRQILPSDYGFAHASGIDLTQPVDWQGGKPWPEVLKAALTPIGLTASITGDTVLLQKAGASAPAASATMAAPPVIN